MNFLVQKIQIFLLPCLYCGSFYRTSGPFCESCFNSLKFFEQDELGGPKQGPYPICSFYDWHPGQSDILSSLFLALKGSRGRSNWQFFATIFVNRKITSFSPSLPIAIVPAPNKEGKVDHAYLWAQGLAKALGARLVPCLRKHKNGHQRGATRNLRRRIRFEVIENYSEMLTCTDQYFWVFADDILTTGSTGQAAYEAMGCPPYFEVWVLGQRSLSCGASLSLI